MRRPPSAPPQLPGYTFIKLLGSGGFSDVFLYEQHLPRRRVAVKVLLTDEVTSATRAAFVDEANSMAQLSAHPYIVSILHADVASDDRPYLVMEYCSGPSLAERYKSGPLPVVDVLRIGVRIAGAVATAHAAGILHRDIKPANILTNEFGWPALTDFGISSAVEDDLPLQTASRETLLAAAGTAGSAVGMSVPWSPPEMFEDDPAPDVRADVFSLAATLYTLLAGHTPFEVPGRPNGTLDLIGRIERGMITPPGRDDVPRSLISVLTTGMAVRRDDRFDTAIDLARALQRVELELGYPPTTIDVPNLTLADTRADGVTGADQDATRARGVATIQAQPAPTGGIEAQPVPAGQDETRVRAVESIVAQPPARPTLAVADAGVIGETVVRPAQPRPTGEQAATPQPEPAASLEDAPRQPAPRARMSRANRLALWWGGGAAAVIAAAVAISLILTGPPAAPDADADGDGPAVGGQPAVVETVPQPELAGAEEVGGTVTFTVTNPDPQPDDRMIWQRVDRGDTQPRQRVEGDTITVDGFTGAPVCLQVHVVRAGRESATPLEVCYPE